MKRTVSIFALLVLTGLSCLAPARAQTEDPIESIRKQYSTINSKVPTYRKVKKNLTGFSAEGGELVAWFHGPSIMKLTATFLGEMGRATEEYYFWNGKLIFVFRQDSNYSKPLSGKVVSKKENRYYFANDKLIRWIDENGKQAEPTAATESEYLKNSKEFSEGAKSKSRTVESKQ